MSSSLYNLQTLKLVDYKSLMKVDLRDLINLRHLLVKGCPGLKLMGINKITNLHMLDQFNVHDDGDGGNKLENLKELNRLQGSLWIKHKANANGYSGEKTIMVNKARLQHLVIEFWAFWEGDREVLDALQPHPSLESFNITYYGVTTLTTDWWSSLSNLKSLYIDYCNNCEFQPSPEKLASLESLDIRFFKKVKKIRVEFLRITDDPSTFISSFPKLKQLSFMSMESWESWKGVEEETTTTTRIIPCLSELHIINCPRLQQLPYLLWKAPLQTVDFDWSPRIQANYKK